MAAWSNAKYVLDPRNAPSREIMRKLDWLLRNGSTEAFAVRQTGLTLLRVKRYRSLMTGLPRFCGCGERWKHPDSCWWRVNSTLTTKAELNDIRELRRARLAIREVMRAVNRASTHGFEGTEENFGREER